MNFELLTDSYLNELSIKTVGNTELTLYKHDMADWIINFVHLGNFLVEDICQMILTWVFLTNLKTGLEALKFVEQVIQIKRGSMPYNWSMHFCQ